MSERTLSALVEEIQAKLARITPWLWALESIAEKSNEFAVGQAYREDGTAIEGRIPEWEWVEDVVIERRACVGMNESGHANFADAEFIAAAPRLLSEALAYLQRLERALVLLNENKTDALAQANHYALNSTPKAAEVCEFWRGSVAAIADMSAALTPAPDTGRER